MPRMPYLELKGSVVTKSNKIKGSAPTLFDTRNSRRLVDNPNDVLSPYRLYSLMRGFAHPDQEFVYCYKAPRELLEQFSRIRECRGYQMTPTRRIGKNSIGKVHFKSNDFVYLFFFLLNVRPFLSIVLRKTQRKGTNRGRTLVQEPLLA